MCLREVSTKSCWILPPKLLVRVSDGEVRDDVGDCVEETCRRWLADGFEEPVVEAAHHLDVPRVAEHAQAGQFPLLGAIW